MSIFDFMVQAQDGTTVPLSEYKGKVLLIVKKAVRAAYEAEKPA